MAEKTDKYSVAQPLRMRRDYDSPEEDSVESAMIKPNPTQQYTPEKIVEESGSKSVPSNPKGFTLICPSCEEEASYVPQDDVREEDVLVCPKCASKVPLKVFKKNASGKYTIKTANAPLSILDAHFKRVNKILPSKPKELHLEKEDVKVLIDTMGKMEDLYYKFKKALREAR